MSQLDLVKTPNGRESEKPMSSGLVTPSNMMANSRENSVDSAINISNHHVMVELKLQQMQTDQPNSGNLNVKLGKSKMNYKQSNSIKPGKSNRKKQPVTRASSGMNFFLGTIKYEPEEIEEPSDPNKLD